MDGGRNFPVPQPVSALLDALETAGFEAYLVGGCVRDYLRGVAPHDFDVTSSALPEETARVFEGWPVIATGLRHGTLTVLCGAERVPVEVTTYRVDGAYSDGRHPDGVTFTRSLREDLARRDFTVNAMAYSPRRGLTDCFGGREDLRNGVIRCVGEASRRFREDSLRILRGLRFASTLRYSIEPETAAAMFAECGGVVRVSKERIAAEWRKLLRGDCGAILRGYRPVLEAALPGLAALSGRHWDDVCEKIDRLPPDELTRLPALLYPLGREGAETHLRLLKADNAALKTVSALAEAAAAQLPDTVAGCRALIAALGMEDAARLCDLAEIFFPESAPLLREQYLLCRNGGVVLTARGLAVGGRDLLALGYTGAEISDALERVLAPVRAGELPNDRGTLLEWLKNHRSRA